MLTKVIEIGKVFESSEIYRNFAEPVTIEKGITIVFGVEPVRYLRTRIDERPADSTMLLYATQKGEFSGKSCTVNIGLTSGEEKIRKNVQKVFKKLLVFFGSDELEKFKKELELNRDSILEEIVQRSLELKQAGTKSSYINVCRKG